MSDINFDFENEIRSYAKERQGLSNKEKEMVNILTIGIKLGKKIALQQALEKEPA